MVCEVGGSPNGVAAPCFPYEPHHDDYHLRERHPEIDHPPLTPRTPHELLVGEDLLPHLLWPIERSAYACSSSSCRIVRACETSTLRCATPATLRLRGSDYPRPFCPDLPPCAGQKVFDPPPPLRFGQSVSFRPDPPHSVAYNQ